MRKRMKLQVKIKEAFNKLWVYPANDQARDLAKLMRREVFTKDDLKQAKEQGYEIEILPSYSVDDLLKAKNLK